MSWTAQWRTRAHLDDAVLLLDEQGSVRAAIPATPLVLSRFLTGDADLDATTSDAPLEVDDPEDWGQLVLERGAGGEVLEVDPELFWHGIYAWFRARGVDYDAPEQPARSTTFLSPEFSSLMDD